VPMRRHVPVDRDITRADQPAVGEDPVNFVRKEEHEGSERQC
jgi:hypothetical protein